MQNSKITKFADVPAYTRQGCYTVNVPWKYLPENIHRWQTEHGSALLDLEPDFQRGHVWTVPQQVAFVEYVLRGGMSGRYIYFNCAGWMHDFRGPFVIVDGLQRITAALDFLNNKIQAFGSYYKEFTDTLNISDAQFIFNVNNLKTRQEVLQWYIQMNEGGTPHTPEEIEKVRNLLKGAA